MFNLHNQIRARQNYQENKFLPDPLRVGVGKHSLLVGAVVGTLISTWYVVSSHAQSNGSPDLGFRPLEMGTKDVFSLLS